MENINIEFSLVKDDKKGKILMFKVLDDIWEGSSIPHLFAEIGECILNCSYRKICFDLSNLTFMQSNNFGAFSHLSKLAKKHNKIIQIRVSKSVMKAVQLTSLDKIINIEEVV